MSPSGESRKLSALLSAAAGAVLLTLLILIWWPRKGGESSDRGGLLAERAWWPAPKVPAAEPWPRSLKDPGYGAVVHRRLLPWLTARKRDAEGLVAAWELTGEEALLDEAAARFPHHPRVCLAMIARLSKDERAPALPWIERFIAAEPENPEGYFLKTWALRYPQGRGFFRPQAPPEEWLPAMRAGVAARGSRRTHAQERLQLRREAAMGAGADAALAARIAVIAPAAFSVPSAEALTGLGGRAPADTEPAAVIEARLDMNSLALAVADKLMADGSIYGQLVALMTRKRIGPQVPANRVVTPDGRTAAEVIADLAAVPEGVVDYSPNAKPRLAEVSHAAAAEYVDRYVAEGELAAMAGLETARREEARAKKAAQSGAALSAP